MANSKAATTSRAAPAEAPAIPTTMRAAVIDRFGPPEVLGVRTVPVPQPGPREVLIALHAAGVGIWDAKIRDGTWASGEERFPLVLGADGAGVVAARGERVRRFRVGEWVWAYEYANPTGGFYAEYVAVDVDHVGRVPAELDLLRAGAAAVTGLTALQGIDVHLRVRRGETVLIFGASGAVGTLAVQFAKRRRARVLGTATGDDAATLVLGLGADGVADARRADFVERLRELAPAGLDAVLALAGGDALERAIDLVRAGGRVAYPNGVEPEPRRRDTLRPQGYDAVADPREWERLYHTVDEAKVQVPIAAVYPLEQAAEAHARVERGHVLGRVVLRIREDGD
ncbi:MAG TPA: NADP-dependent oxidoreductase [Longimicrobiales bacterium]|nr:NADP-dependent oxidoreductase [Longimicrobiales bacterium]